MFHSHSATLHNSKRRDRDGDRVKFIHPNALNVKLMQNQPKLIWIRYHRFFYLDSSHDLIFALSSSILLRITGN